MESGADGRRRYDNAYAIQQIEDGHNSILSRAPATHADRKGPSLQGKTLPRVITLGGDHTITLPLLRSVTRAYGPITVIHFDSHLYAPPPTSLSPVVPIPFRFSPHPEPSPYP